MLFLNEKLGKLKEVNNMDIDKIKYFIELIANRQNWNNWTDEYGNFIDVLEWIGDEDIQLMAIELLRDLE